MFRTLCTLALFGLGGLAAAQPPANQDPTAKGSQETSASKPHIPSAGLTMEMLNGLPRVREAAPVYRSYYYQPYSYQPYYYGYGGFGGVYPYYNYGGLYPYYTYTPVYNSYAYPFGMGGYYPPGAGGRYYGGWGWGYRYW